MFFADLVKNGRFYLRIGQVGRFEPQSIFSEQFFGEVFFLVGGQVATFPVCPFVYPSHVCRPSEYSGEENILEREILNNLRVLGSDGINSGQGKSGKEVARTPAKSGKEESARPDVKGHPVLANSTRTNSILTYPLGEKINTRGPMRRSENFTVKILTSCRTYKVNIYAWVLSGPFSLLVHMKK